MPTKRQPPLRKVQSLSPHGTISELLIVHQALEGWIHRQHVITREIVVKESTKLRTEIAALRKALRHRS